MNLTTKMTLSFSEEDVKSIIAEHIRRNGFELIGDVHINVGTQLQGYGPAEHEEVVFKEISVEVRQKPKTSFGNNQADSTVINDR